MTIRKYDTAMATLQVEIPKTLNRVKDLSFKEKSNYVTQEVIDNLLDNILDIKAMLSATSNEVFDLVYSFEKLTWTGKLTNDQLKVMIEIIALSRYLHSILDDKYKSYHKVLRQGNIAREELEIFKNAVDDLYEVTNDIEEIYFVLPNIPEFANTTQRLSMI